MLKQLLFVLIIIAVTISLIGLTAAQDGGKKDLASRLVNQCAHIGEGDHVWIYGSVRDMDLMEEIAIATRKAGAFPVIQVGSEQMNWRMFNERPAEYDSQERTFALKLAEIIDVQINVDVGENLNLFADADPKRLAASSKAFQPVNDIIAKRNTRGIFIGNAMYPTENLAKRWGVSLDQLSDMFWKGVSADYKTLEATGQKLKDKLSGSKTMHLTHTNGTDLKMQIENRPVFVSDGIISEEDIKSGYSACQAYLPAGELMVAPVAGTVQGKVIIDRMFYAGKEINGLTMSFEKGKLVSMTSKSDISRLKADYDAAGSGKEKFALIDIGINPDVHIIPDSKMTSWIPAGMVTVGIGNNTWAGGENTVNYGLFGHLEGSTVSIDGNDLVKNGQLKI